MTEPFPAIHRAGALARRFEELLKSSGSDEQFLRDVASHSAGSAESPWEALAAIDQLYRRGKLSSQLFRSARIGIERRALGVYEESGRAAAGAKSLRSVPGRSGVHPDAQPLSPVRTPANSTERPDRAEVELRHLRAELERARREASAYLQRLEQLSWPGMSVSADPVTSLTPPAPVSSHLPTPAQPPASLPQLPMPALTAAPVPSRALVVVAPPPGLGKNVVPLAQPAGRALTQWSALPVRRPRSLALRWRAGLDWLLRRFADLQGRRTLWLLRLSVLAAGLLLLARLPAVNDAPAMSPPAAVTTSAATPAAASPTEFAPAPQAAAGVVTMASERYVLQPGDRLALIDLRRSQGSEGEVSVQWRVSAASAQHGRDYGGPTRGRLVLAPGVTQAQIAIPVLRNPERRHTEFFDVRLVSAEGVQLGELKRATVFLMPAER
jgi:hypothetical protein